MSDISPSSVRHFDRLLLAVSLIVSLAVAAGSLRAVPEFRSTFSAMGSDLPWFTQAALSCYPALFALPVAVLAVWWLWPNRARRGIACIAIGVGGSIFAVSLLVAALQYPTLQAAGALGNAL